MRVERKSSGAWEKRILSTLNYKLSTLLVFLALAQGLAAEENSSLSESKIENEKTVVAGVSPAPDRALQPTRLPLQENEELRKQLSLARESVKTLTDSLAASNVEAEVFRRKHSDLQLRMEALGLDGTNKDRAKLEQRLLSAVSDLRLMQKDRERYRDQMLGLSEAIIHLLKTSTGGEALARMEVEAQLRSSNELATKVRGSSEETATLMDGRVISVKEAIVGEGPTMKRMMARARGSGSRILKRSSHIRIVLTDEIKIETRETRKAEQKAAKKKAGEGKAEDESAKAKAKKPAKRVKKENK